MGNYFASNIEDNIEPSLTMEEKMKKNQELIQSVTLERQIQMQYQMQERQMAMQIAKNREFSLWFTTFYATAAAGLFTGFRRTKKTYFLVPLMPLTFATLYYLDLGYGNKLHRIRMEAEHIMTHEADLLELPCGLPTPSSLDLGRFDVEEKKKIHPPLL